MEDEGRQAERFDQYADQFTVTLTPFGANLSFALREAHPSPGQSPRARQLGTIRMSVEHLKTLVFITRRQILKVEDEMGVKAEVPRDLLRQLGIPGEDWDNFWRLPFP